MLVFRFRNVDLDFGEVGIGSLKSSFTSEEGDRPRQARGSSAASSFPLAPTLVLAASCANELGSSLAYVQRYSDP